MRQAIIAWFIIDALAFLGALFLLFMAYLWFEARMWRYRQRRREAEARLAALREGRKTALQAEYERRVASERAQP